MPGDRLPKEVLDAMSATMGVSQEELKAHSAAFEPVFVKVEELKDFFMEIAGRESSDARKWSKYVTMVATTKYMLDESVPQPLRMLCSVTDFAAQAQVKKNNEAMDKFMEDKK